MSRSWCNAWLLLLPFAAHAGDLEQGLAAYHSKNYAQAFLFLQPLAEQGAPAAQYTLGEMYRRGRGFVPSMPDALPLLRQAAAANSPPAFDALGHVHASGEGVQGDEAGAVQWFQKAAEAGDAKGQLHLGIYYIESQDERDFEKAAAWLKRAAQQNEAEAQYFYARLLLDGKGVPQDQVQAMVWFGRASAQGHAAAQRFLYLLRQADTPDRALALRELKRHLAAGEAVLESVSSDPRYGFDQADPIKTGRGFAAEWRYLNALRGPHGEIMHYRYLGYCCVFDTDAAERGKGFLDRYALTYEGLTKPFILYLDMFQAGQAQAPAGFSFGHDNTD